MPPERYQELVFELEALYRSSRMRQKDLAGSLNMSPQQLSEILSLRNRPTAAQILAIQDFLKDNPMSSTPVFDIARTRQKTSRDDDQVDFMSTESHASWGDTREALGSAQEEIVRLRAALASAKAAPAAAVPTPAPPVTKLPTLAASKAAAATKPPFSATDPKNWNGKPRFTAFPENCNNPREIAEYISGLSTQSLRDHLKGSPATDVEAMQQRLTLRELQNRKRI